MLRLATSYLGRGPEIESEIHGIAVSTTMNHNLDNSGLHGQPHWITHYRRVILTLVQNPVSIFSRSQADVEAVHQLRYCNLHLHIGKDLPNAAEGTYTKRDPCFGVMDGRGVNPAVWVPGSGV